MDSYKDVMLSEPPSRFTAPPSVQPVNLETYKGILLCDRPQAAAARNDAPIPFLPAGKGEDRFIGVQPSTEQRARLQMIRNTNMAKNQTGNAIVTKHKRWLKSFAQTVQQAKLDQMESKLVSDARAAAFRDRQSELRRQAVSTKVVASPQGEEVSKKPKAKENAKPKWAMTAEEADIAEDDELLTQHDDLLKFAQELDYDRFINDLEVKEAMAIMKERVEEIIAEQGGDYRSPTEGGTRKVAAPKLENSSHQEALLAPGMVNPNDWNSSTRAGDFANTINAEALALAEKILAGSESLRQIHTKHTLARLLRDAVDTKRKTALNADTIVSGSLQQPTIVKIGAESTGHEAAPAQRRVLTEMRKANDKAQNLPYLYRCPAL